MIESSTSNLFIKLIMATMLETPSRIWRRIEAVEDRDMPSLPSLSPFEDSVSLETPHTRRLDVSNSTKKSSPSPESPDRASFFSTASSHESPPFEESVDPEPKTPHTGRRSFLLDINPTARPRISMAPSHDLTTHHRVNTSTPYDGTKKSSPGPESPDRASFITTASSHDLKTHHRVNTSFDPRTPYDGSKNSSPELDLPDRAPFISTVSSHEQTFENSVDPDPETPHTRRRSFLLDIINSTARPRISMASSPHNLTTHYRVNTSFDPRTPYDGTKKSSPGPDSPDRASFISTASSHDLTTHHRVNTSFDPAMGFGTAPGHGVGRFNATKLNNYLHGLNRRLQQENEDLTERLKIIEEEKKDEGPSRRVSSVRMSLGNVQEDMAEGWLEEKAELEDMVEKFQTGLTSCMAEKKEIETALKQEKESRERDMVIWRERMTEIEQGVSGIIADLEQKLDLRRLENDDLRRALEDRNNDLQCVEKEKDEIAAEKSDVARTVASLEADLKRTRRDAETLSQDLELLRMENDKLKTESKEEISKAERSKMQDVSGIIAGLEQKLDLRRLEIDDLRRALDDRTNDLQRVEKERMAGVEQGVSEIIASLEQKLDLRRLEVDDLRRALDDRNNTLQRIEKEKDKIATEKSDVARTVASLEADLKRTRRDAEAFSQDVKLLRMENVKLKTESKEEISKAERSKMQGVSGIIAGLEQKLDLCRLEIDDLHRSLDDRTNDLQRVEKEKDKIVAEKGDVARTVASLEVDLKRTRREAEAFCQDVKLLRMENDKLKTGNRDEISKAERLKMQGVSGIIAGLEQKLDLCRLEIDDLHRSLDDRTNDLQRVEKEKDKIATEKNDVARTVASLEADLKRIRRDAEAFGQDLKLLRKENDKLKTENKDEISKAERSKKQAQTQARLLNEQLEMQKENVLKARQEIKNYIGSAYVYVFFLDVSRSDDFLI